MRKKSAVDRDISIPKVRDRALRNSRDIYKSLQRAFPERFYNPFTDDQREMVEAMMHAAKHGGDQAIAATRGDGKTTLAECVITLLICWGLLRFPAVFAATGRDAEQILSNIKGEFEGNDRLHAAWPEVCEPVRMLEGAPQRAGGQTVDGVRTRMQWSGDGVRFPTVPGSKASGALLKTRGLDGAIRGVREGSLRPDFALIDDPDTEESAKSPSQQQSREAAIERAIGGLGGPGRKFGRLMLCTLINDTCIAARFTDPKVKPSWRGKRFKFLKAMPEREDLWGEFVRLRQEGFDPNSDVEIEAAHRFYLANRSKMDAGADVSNEYRFNADAFPPESSALEHFYNQVADKGWPVVKAELQNEPESEEVESKPGLTPALVAKRLSGSLRNMIPSGHLCITAAIDTGQRKGCHYEVVAWYPGGRGIIIDYGVQDVHNVEALGPQMAVKNALHAWREERLNAPYVLETGEPAKIDLCLVDSGDGQLESAVYQFVREVGAPFRASKGFGSRHDLSPFRSVPKASADRKPGEHWYQSRQLITGGGSLWLVGVDADHWKEWAHDRFLTQPRDENGTLRPGSMTLFGNDAREHQTFAHHICAEQQEQEFVRDKGMVRKWVVRNRNNDWLDCTAYACAAAAILGVRLSGPTLRMTPAAPRPRARIKFAG